MRCFFPCLYCFQPALETVELAGKIFQRVRTSVFPVFFLRMHRPSSDPSLWFSTMWCPSSLLASVLQPYTSSQKSLWAQRGLPSYQIPRSEIAGLKNIYGTWLSVIFAFLLFHLIQTCFPFAPLWTAWEGICLEFFPHEFWNSPYIVRIYGSQASFLLSVFPIKYFLCLFLYRIWLKYIESKLSVFTLWFLPLGFILWNDLYPTIMENIHPHFHRVVLKFHIYL